uniref:Uncharacterized protein n=1 Tax=Arundo donax TaxID=35708 RepID=A0A0A8ZJN3_ARUDO
MFSCQCQNTAPRVIIKHLQVSTYSLATNWQGPRSSLFLKRN